MHGIRRKVFLLDDACVAHHHFKVGDARLKDSLVILCFVIFAVLGKVAERKRFFNFFRNFFSAVDLQILQFSLQCRKAFLCNKICLFCHSK